MIAKFMQDNPKIKVKEQAFPHIEYLRTILSTAMAGGSPPDVYAHVGFDSFFQYKGATLDITDWYKANAAKRYPTGVDAAYTQNGHFYGVPWTISSCNFLYYNKRMLDGLGFTADDLATFDSWHKVNDAALAKGIQPFAFSGVGWNCVHWISNFMVRSIGPDKTRQIFTGQASWTDPGAVDALNMLKDFYNRGYLGKGSAGEQWPVAVENFFNGKTLEGGLVDALTTNIVGVEKKKGAAAAKNFDFVEFPEMTGGAGKRTDWVYWIYMFAATKGSHEAQKLKLLDALGSKDYQGVGYSRLPEVPAALGATDGVKGDWTATKLTDMYQHATSLVPVGDLAVPTSAQQVLDQELSGVLTGAASVNTVLQHVQSAVSTA
jgi:ABC-type glycerol-3-phosphate transport system substrate-binding protein